jgi:hypothetical protein
MKRPSFKSTRALRKWHLGALPLLAVAVANCPSAGIFQSPSTNENPTQTSVAIPAPVFARNTAFEKGQFLGREALIVSLSEDEQLRQRTAPPGGGNRPTFVILNAGLSEGTIELDVAAKINGKGGADARGFVGIAFNITADHDKTAVMNDKYGAVYLRMSNGLLNDSLPPSPRNARAIQYISHPAFDFSVLRERFPGIYEQPAKVRTERCIGCESIYAGPR